LIRQRAAQITKKTLDDAMKELITEDTSSNMNKLSQGLLQQKRKVYRENKAVKGLNKRTNISNCGKLASQTNKIKNLGKDKQMEAALNKYNQIGEMMATRNETPMVLGETAPSRFIQSAARLRKKAFQSDISHVDTRVNLASQKEKQARIRTDNEGISRMDNIIQKKSTAGRPRTRSGEEDRGSRLSIISTTSTQAAMTPKKK
jgi:hypothetical protein